MPSTSHPDAFHFDRPVSSYWEASAAPLDPAPRPLDGDLDCDIAIVGGGYTGLSCALELAENGAGRVVLLEAAEPGWGASGRNGGFVCIGAAKLPWSRMVARYGLAATRAFQEAQLEAIARLRELARRHGFDADMSDDGEISLAHRPSRLDDLKAEAGTLLDLFGLRCEILSPEELRGMGLHSPAFHGAMLNPVGYSLHPLKLARGLAAAAMRAGTVIFSHSPVSAWERNGSTHRLYTPRGTVTARQVVLACNGFTQEQVFPSLAGRIMPVLSNIIVTRPLTRDELAAQGWTSTRMCFDTRILLHYFRLLPDGRFLFGGRGGTDASEAGLAPMERQIRRDFEELFPAWKHVGHEYFWRGLACLAHDLVPYLGPLDGQRSLWTALAYHGNGVAMANWSGYKLARVMLGKDRLEDVPPVMTRRLARFPLPALRPVYLKTAYAGYGIKDRFL
jgi:glycine/D-amino acid oxidase-like deaminating enzyme